MIRRLYYYLSIVLMKVKFMKNIRLNYYYPSNEGKTKQYTRSATQIEKHKKINQNNVTQFPPSVMTLNFIFIFYFLFQFYYSTPTQEPRIIYMACLPHIVSHNHPRFKPTRHVQLTYSITPRLNWQQLLAQRR